MGIPMDPNMTGQVFIIILGFAMLILITVHCAIKIDKEDDKEIEQTIRQYASRYNIKQNPFFRDTADEDIKEQQNSNIPIGDKSQ